MIHEKMPDSKSSCSSGSCASSKNNAVKTSEELSKIALSRIKYKLVVMSGKGGVGKSSVACNLAVCLAKKGFKTGLMDVDVHGPSVGKIMGMKGLLDASDDHMLIPMPFGDNLKVVSMQSLLPHEDQPIIWRGPAKGNMIQQFIGSVKWEDLDFLIIDAPPGTGDEPLTVIQTVEDAKAVIVTTPQDVALADVRKSINFCKTVNMEILGLVENMGPFPCPHCGEVVSPFSSGGGERTASEMGIMFLGSVPFDTQVVTSCDMGVPIADTHTNGPFMGAFDAIVEKALKNL
ncbi:Mrp/NBP35 family ATP-binding protein [Desulforegula conservatrix]|uniref:Mrp/NBP35 family ATP-binding protein n=1 Tax=Desulforegula conservatrix TaxID=153026 RepID=UPI00040BE21D|nr:Mrp/NBP35 family ATP-binding protein [Desulforegula conservatrix]